MTAHFIKIAHLSTIILILYLFLKSTISAIRGTPSAPVLDFYDVLSVTFITLLLSYAFIDTATLAGVVRLNIGSFTVSLRRDVVKPLILYDDEWNVDCLRVREALSSLGIPVLIYPVPKLSSNTHYFLDYPIESRYIADAIIHHPQLKLVIPLLYDPNTGAVIYGGGEHINNYIYSTYSKRLTDVDPPPPLTIGPLDDATSFISVFLRKGSVHGAIARPSIYNKLPLHFYGNQADGPSRVVREWLCRLQLSYILFPTSRGAIYRAVLLHQVGSFYHTHRSKLVYERFNILASYEHQRKQLLDTLNSEDFGGEIDKIDWLEKVSGGKKSPNQFSLLGSNNKQSNRQNPLDLTGGGLHQTVILQDPIKNDYTIMKGGTAHANLTEDIFIERLKDNGYSLNALHHGGMHHHGIGGRSNANYLLNNTHSLPPAPTLPTPNDESFDPSSSNLHSRGRKGHFDPRNLQNNENLSQMKSYKSGLGDASVSVENMYRTRLLHGDESADVAPPHHHQSRNNPDPANTDGDYVNISTPTPPPQNQSENDLVTYVYAIDQGQNNSPLQLMNPGSPTIDVVDDDDPLPSISSVRRADAVRSRFESMALGSRGVKNSHGRMNDFQENDARNDYHNSDLQSHNSFFDSNHTQSPLCPPFPPVPTPFGGTPTLTPTPGYYGNNAMGSSLSSFNPSELSSPSAIAPLATSTPHVNIQSKLTKLGQTGGSHHPHKESEDKPSRHHHHRHGNKAKPTDHQQTQTAPQPQPLSPPLPPSVNVDERLLMTSLSTFQRSVGLTMIYDPNTEITAFGEVAIVRYLLTLYSFDTTVPSS